MRVLNYYDKKAKNYGSSFFAALLKRYELRRLIEFLPESLGHEGLDLGCGAGQFASEVLKAHPELKMTVVDQSQAMLTQITSDPSTVSKFCASIEGLQLNKSFDFISALGVIEFLQCPELLFETVNRHAKPNTQFLVFYPPKTLSGFIYKCFHKSHGVQICLFSPRELKRIAYYFGWTEVATAQLHSYGVCTLLRRAQ